MAERYVNVDRETPMLLPPDLRDWVADNDLARLILEAVELCDVESARGNVRGSGSEQYPPTMLLAVLIYSYATGVFSSRRIERATYDSVAVRYLCGNHHPDHTTIAEFRRRQGALFTRCFATVAQLAREMGVLRLGAISLDGTKLAGAASKRSVRTLAQIEAELEELAAVGAGLLGQAEAADRTDGDGGGTQLPPELTDVEVRREKLRAARAQLLERRQRAPEATPVKPTDKVSLSEPESRMLRTDGAGGSVQGYNAQIAVDAGASGLIVGLHLSDEANDHRLVGAGVATVVAEAGQPKVVLVDTGYESSARIAQVEAEYGLTVLCPPGRRPQTDPTKTRRSKAKQRAFAWRQKMQARFTQPGFRELYRRRAVTVEPAFARIKRHLGFQRLHCWGLRAASAEWTLVCLAHNLRMLQNKRPRS